MPVNSNCSMLLRMRPRGSMASSTKTANLAPLDKASRPSAPVPAKRSNTFAPSISKSSKCFATPWAILLNMASRTRSVVGRVSVDFGVESFLPLWLPPTMRIIYFLLVLILYGVVVFVPEVCVLVVFAIWFCLCGCQRRFCLMHLVF